MLHKATIFEKKTMKKIFILLCYFLVIGSTHAQLAPDFTITDSDGVEHNLYTDYLDQGKTVVIEFFFTTCPPCNAIAPLLVPLYDKWGSGNLDVEFIALSVHTWDTNANVSAYKANHNHTFPGAGFDGGAYAAGFPYLHEDLFPFYGATPTFAVISPDKTVQFDPKGDTHAATVDSIDVAIANTGARRIVELSGEVIAPNGNALDDYQLIVNNDTISVDTIYSDGSFSTSLLMRPQDTYSITPYRYNAGDWPLGISTFDIIKIQKHILGITPFEYELQGVAGDVDFSGNLSVSDAILIREIVLDLSDGLLEFSPWLFFTQDDSSQSSYQILGEENDSLDFFFIKKGDPSLSIGDE